jgi:hypothetical protein
MLCTQSRAEAGAKTYENRSLRRNYIIWAPQHGWKQTKLPCKKPGYKGKSEKLLGVENSIIYTSPSLGSLFSKSIQVFSQSCLCLRVLCTFSRLT